MRVTNECSGASRRDDDSNSFARKLADNARSKRGGAGGFGRGGETPAGVPARDGVSGRKGAQDDGPTTPTGSGGGTPMPVEPDGGIGDGAGPIPADPDDPIATTLAIGEEDGGAGGGPIPVEPDGGIGDGAGPIPTDPGDPIATTLAIGEEDGGAGGGPIPVEPDGGIGDGAGPIPTDPDDPIATTLAIGEEDGGAGGGPIDEGGTIIGTRGNDTLQGTNGDDLIKGRKGDDTITTGQGTDTVRGGKGDDTIIVTGGGDKKINGGKGHDTLELKGQASDYAIQHRQSSTVYTAADGSRIVARNIESVRFTGVTPPEPPTDPGFVVFYTLAPNDLGATNLDIDGDTATLTGPNGTDFTFTGVDPSALAFDGPIVATGGSGTINGEETTAVPVADGGGAVLTIGSGFGGTVPVSAAFANGDTLETTVTATAQP